MKPINPSLKQVQKLQFQLLKESLKFITKKSEYYRNKLKKYGVNIPSIKNLNDIVKLPLTYPEELRRNPYDFLTKDIKKVNFLTCSSGTTGKQKIIFTAVSEKKARLRWPIKPKRGDRIALINILGSPSVFLRFMI